MTLVEFLENAKNGILEDRLNAFVPLDLFGPPTEAESPRAWIIHKSPSGTW